MFKVDVSAKEGRVDPCPPRKHFLVLRMLIIIHFKFFLLQKDADPHMHEKNCIKSISPLEPGYDDCCTCTLYNYVFYSKVLIFYVLCLG